MGSRNADRIHISERRPRCETVAAMARDGWVVIAACDVCRVKMSVSLGVLARVRGPDYSLWNRRGRCKVVGCRGRVAFLADVGCGRGFEPLQAPDRPMERVPAWKLRRDEGGVS